MTTKPNIRTVKKALAEVGPLTITFRGVPTQVSEVWSRPGGWWGTSIKSRSGDAYTEVKGPLKVALTEAAAYALSDEGRAARDADAKAFADR